MFLLFFPYVSYVLPISLPIFWNWGLFYSVAGRRDRKACCSHSHIHWAITGECFTHSLYSREDQPCPTYQLHFPLKR